MSLTNKKPRSDGAPGATRVEMLEKRPAERSRAGLRTRLARWDTKGSPYLLIAPFFVLFAIFGIFPLVYTLWVSLHAWDLIGTGTQPFIGLENYRVLLGDPYFWNAVRNTFGIFILATVPQLLAALALAHVLNRRLRGRTLFRMGVLLPNITSIAAVAIIFNQLFGRDFGLVNYLLGIVGIDAINWQAHWWSSWIAIATMVDWRWTGYNALIYLAAMQVIPPSLYEAAEIDGASQLRQFWSVTIPLLRPTIIFTVIIATIGGMQLFAEPLLFDTSPSGATGGAGRQFQTLALYLYENAFLAFRFGYAAAIAWVLFIIVIVVSALNYLVTRRIRSSQ